MNATCSKMYMVSVLRQSMSVVVALLSFWTSIESFLVFSALDSSFSVIDDDGMALSAPSASYQFI